MVLAVVAALTTPAPARRRLYGVMPPGIDADALAVSMRDALTASALHDGCAWTTRAAAPEVCGAAIEVPLNETPPVPVPIAVETMLLPGAAISGFTALSYS